MSELGPEVAQAADGALRPGAQPETSPEPASTEGLFEQVSAVAAKLVDKATEDEPKCTMLLQVAARKHGGELHGLQHCLKSQESLTRKLMSAVDQIGGTPALREREARGETLLAMAQDQSFVEQDVLRYTVELSTDTYVTGVREGWKVAQENNFQEVHVNFCRSRQNM